MTAKKILMLINILIFALIAKWQMKLNLNLITQRNLSAPLIYKITFYVKFVRKNMNLLIKWFKCNMMMLWLLILFLKTKDNLNYLRVKEGVFLKKAQRIFFKARITKAQSLLFKVTVYQQVTQFPEIKEG